MKLSVCLVPTVAAICLVPGSVPATAQTPAHLSMRDIPPAERARDTMGRFAACVVKARPNITREALSKTTMAESTAALSDLVKPECLGEGTLRMDPNILRGALYRALYIREFGEKPVALQQVPGSGQPAAPDATQPFGDCVVRAAPAQTQMFVVAAPATSEEKRALADLGPALTGCIDPRVQIRFTPAALEAMLAEALYKYAVALSQSTDAVDEH